MSNLNKQILMHFFSSAFPIIFFLFPDQNFFRLLIRSRIVLRELATHFLCIWFERKLSVKG